MKERIAKALCKLPLFYKGIRYIVKSQNVLVNPNLYFDCSKRIINPQICLTQKHLQECKVVANREELLNFIPKNGRCAEVGVAQGYFSDKILSICKPEKLYMIEYDKHYCQNLKARFHNQIERGQVEILEGDSVETLSLLQDNSLDFVYLDATHDYEHPKRELEVSKLKVKDNGFICGHDYVRFSMWEQEQYGVIESVNEFIICNDYQLSYISLDMLQSNSSYAIRKSKVL